MQESPKPRRNQGLRSGSSTWRHGGLTYASPAEVVLAKELESRGIPFAPLPVVSVGQVRAEVDFLVLYGGRVMIPEVNGDHFHPPRRMADEWNRVRPLLRHGVRIDFIAARDLFADPGSALDRALDLLFTKVD